MFPVPQGEGVQTAGDAQHGANRRGRIAGKGCRAPRGCLGSSNELKASVGITDGTGGKRRPEHLVESEGKTVATARIQRVHQGKRRGAGPPAGGPPDRDNPADGPAQVTGCGKFAGAPDMDTAARTTGLLTAGRNRGARPLDAYALTVELESVPSEHDGSSAFTVQLTLSGDRPIPETVSVTVVRAGFIASFSEKPGEHHGSAFT